MLPHTGLDEFIHIAVRRGDEIVLKYPLLMMSQPHVEPNLLLPSDNAPAKPKA